MILQQRTLLGDVYNIDLALVIILYFVKECTSQGAVRGVGKGAYKIYLTDILKVKNKSIIWTLQNRVC